MERQSRLEQKTVRSIHEIRRQLNSFYVKPSKRI